MRRVTMVNGLAYAILNWPTAANPFGWALVDVAYVPDEVTGRFMDSVAPNEFTDAGYARQAATSLTVGVTLPVAVGDPGYYQFECDPPDFGVMSGGNSAAGLVLFGDTGSDATSPIIGVYPLAYTADGSQCLVDLSSYGAVAVSTVCPSEF